MKNLIIVESPAKARTIKNFLGKDYEVIASKGHIRDLPKAGGLGIKVEDQKFTPTYTITKDHEQLVKQMQELSKNAKTTYIATDEDREGEAIGYHITQALKLDSEKCPRIVFHEITKTAIQNALQNPRTLDMHKVNAQQARRLLDRIVGFKLSNLVALKIAKGLSAGRVQSAALKIIVDKEREIKAFKITTYYEIFATFSALDSKGKSAEIEAELTKFNSKILKKHELQDSAIVENMLGKIRANDFRIHEIEKKIKSTPTPPPFMTSTLQQAASTMLNLSPTRTMSIAQKLYEGVATNEGIMGVITYMRTDSLNIAKEAQSAALKLLEQQYGKDFVPAKPKIYASKSKGAQEAHEAIRPTNLNFTPQIAREFLTADELKLYKLIYERFLASQSTDAKFESQNIIFSDSQNSIEFKASGRKLVFDGFYRILGAEDKDKLLPDLKQGDGVKLQNTESKQKQTEPPARYTEASLIKKLESEGIGRPSTYAPTIALLKNREYLSVEKKALIPEPSAFKVTQMLESAFNEIVDSKFSASLEDKLDLIAQGGVEWNSFLWEFYEPFMAKIESGKKNIASQKIATPTGEKCPECGGELVLRNGRYGEFVACGNYPKCKFVKREKKEEASDESAVDSQNEQFGVCEKCGSKMVKKSGLNGEFLACSAYPKCKNTKSLKPVEKLAVKCPECGGELLKRFSKKGAFFGCANYPKCNFISKHPLIEQRCSCGGALVERELRGKKIHECLKCKTKTPVQD